ncbi:hypothetical protein [Microcoleus sp. B9-D4]|uniref:hypothetical protein n=1 Tax=Microcoleus sp. B9-D4 TaxID=2818711 RepID=UPI002FD52C2A
MNPRFLLQSPANKPRWLVLFLLGLITTLAIAVTTVYFKMAIAQTANPTLSVDVTADRHSISPDIYGVNKISTLNCGFRVYKYGFRATYPANSMTLMAIPKANS